jgi:type I restriction enzyme S subunit
VTKLPKGWTIAKLGDVCEPSQYGYTAKASSSGNIHFLRTTDITSGEIDWETVPFCTVNEQVRRKYVLNDGDVVISRAGSVGYSYLIRQPRPAVFASYLIRFKPLINANYFKWYLQTPAYWNAISEESLGIAVQNVNASKLAELAVPVAPLIEQSRIVAKLEELLSELDDGVAELKVAQKKLVQYRQSLLKAAIEGALTAEWRAKNRPAETGAQLLKRILTERRVHWEARQLAKFEEQGKPPPQDWRKKYVEPVEPNSNDLPSLPSGWVWASIDQLASIGTGVTPLKSKVQYYESGEVPWVTSGALNQELVVAASGFVTPLALRECRLEVYPIGTLLVAMYGEGRTRGKCSELAMPATINQAIAALVLEGSARKCKQYLKTFLFKSYEDMRNQASGGVQPNLNLQIIRSIAVPLPPLDEQTVVQDLLGKLLDVMRRQISAIDQSVKQSLAQRQNVLRAAFAGQLVAQDPDDEPASALLERIRAKRAEGAKQPRSRQHVAEVNALVGSAKKSSGRKSAPKLHSKTKLTVG